MAKGKLTRAYIAVRELGIEQKQLAAHIGMCRSRLSRCLRGIERFTDLRHTAASVLIHQGESPKYIQRQLRHASIDTTSDRYGHLFPETGQEAMKKLDTLLLGRAEGGGQVAE
jgi:integrase